MAHLTSDFCPYNSFDDYSTVFGTTISDPNPLVKQELPPPMSDEEMKAMMNSRSNHRNEPRTLHSVLQPEVNALERKYKVDTIPAEDLRVWKAAMTDAHLEFASKHHEEWVKEIAQARNEVEECKNEGRKKRLEAYLERLETQDARSDEWERFLKRHQVTEEELKDHPMYRPRDSAKNETILHPLALMVKRYREAHPVADEVKEVSDESDTPDEVDATTKTKKDEEVPKAKSWFPSIW